MSTTLQDQIKTQEAIIKGANDKLRVLKKQLQVQVKRERDQLCKQMGATIVEYLEKEVGRSATKEDAEHIVAMLREHSYQ